jgi:hypothetical protein
VFVHSSTRWSSWYAKEDNCGIVNNDPFSYPPPTNSANDLDRCNTLVRQDGKDCIKFYAKFQCSKVCSACLQKPCRSFCDDVAKTCPGAFDGGCFVNMVCDSDNVDCTNWAVDTSKIPDPVKTQSTTSAHVSTTATSTHSTSSSNMLIVGFLFTLGSAVGFFLF